VQARAVSDDLSEFCGEIVPLEQDPNRRERYYPFVVPALFPSGIETWVVTGPGDHKTRMREGFDLVQHTTPGGS
jgi:hypothetical protein